MRAFFVSILLVTIGVQPALAARHARAVKGNIVVIDYKSTPRTLTFSGHDSDPVLSPDGKRVVFVRMTGGKAINGCSADPSETLPAELWSVGADGTGAVRLLAVRSAPDVKSTVCAFNKAQFSSDGQRLYFETPAWATSGAVHMFDFKSGKEHFVTDGDGLEVLNTCADKQHRDQLIIGKHKYFEFGGSYDWLWLVSPSGKEIGPLGESDAMATDACE